MFRRKWKNPNTSCVPIALQDMFGDYEYKDELEEMLDAEYPSGLRLGDIHILQEYIPELYIFRPKMFQYICNQGDIYAAFIDMDTWTRYRILRDALIITFHTRISNKTSHAHCITAHAFGYIYESPLYQHNCQVFNLNGLLIDKGEW